jgi:signal transduction histidine kinase
VLREALVFIPCYIALDWASYLFPLGPFYITPWNPQPALAVVLVMLRGLPHVFAIVVAIFLADVLVRAAPGGLAVAAATAVVLAAGYAGIGKLLQRWVRDPGLRRLRELAYFCAVIAVGTAAVAVAYIGVLQLMQQATGLGVLRGWLRFWIGDFVGIFVTAPVLLLAADPARRRSLARLATSVEAWLQCAILAAMAWAIFTVFHDEAARLFYLLFLPLIWIALRWGMPGAVVAATIAQASVLVGMQNEATLLPILELQALVAAFTTIGLFLGVMSDERLQYEESLRQSLRLAAAGEMAGAIAHEVNQPLTALAVYGESAKMLLERSADPARMHAVLGKMVVEVQRTAEVMRRLRDLFESGTTRLERVEAAELLEAARGIAQAAIGASPIALRIEPPAALPALFIDRVQVQMVLRNLLSNSVQSLSASGCPAPRIVISAQAWHGSMVRITVSDNGPGIPAPTRMRLFQPFVSGKPVGMGLGLAVSRAIAEAHGGSLDATFAEEMQFHLVLPCAPTT